MQVQGRRAWGVLCRRAGRDETSMYILKFYFIFCNCLINRQGPNLSTASQPVYMQDVKSLYISGHTARAIAFSLACWPVSKLSAGPRDSRHHGRWTRSTVLELAPIGHPAVVAAAWRSCRLGMTKPLRTDLVRIVLLQLGNALFLQRAHPCEAASPMNTHTQTPIQS